MDLKIFVLTPKNLFSHRSREAVKPEPKLRITAPAPHKIFGSIGLAAKTLE